MKHFFILAAGLGSRARPLSDIKPKPLFPLNGTPLLTIMLKQLQKKGFKNGFINLHFKPQQIKKTVDSKMDILYFFENSLSGSRILKRSYPLLQKFLLVINGDIYMDIPYEKMLERIETSGADGILLVRKNIDSSYSSIISKGNTFIGINKKSSRKKLMYTGVAIFKKEVIEHIEDTSFFETLKKNPQFYIQIMEHDGLWLDIGSPELYHQANFLYKKHISHTSPNAVSPNVTINATAEVSNSVIWDKTIIKGNSKITNCIITGNMVLNNVYSSNKILMPRKSYPLK
jgi:NDP-sugar pyrophosphorylase family protein